METVVSLTVQDVGSDVRARGRASVALPQRGRLRVRFHPVGNRETVVEAVGSFAEVARRLRAEGGYRVSGAADDDDDDGEVD